MEGNWANTISINALSTSKADSVLAGSVRLLLNKVSNIAIYMEGCYEVEILTILNIRVGSYYSNIDGGLAVLAVLAAGNGVFTSKSTVIVFRSAFFDCQKYCFYSTY